MGKVIHLECSGRDVLIEPLSATSKVAVYEMHEAAIKRETRDALVRRLYGVCGPRALNEVRSMSDGDVEEHAKNVLTLKEWENVNMRAVLEVAPVMVMMSAFDPVSGKRLYNTKEEVTAVIMDDFTTMVREISESSGIQI